MKEPEGPAFFPRLVLKRSKESKTRQILYSANTARIFGKNTHQELYVNPRHLPKPRPEAISIMVYRGVPRQPSKRRNVVRRLDFVAVHPGSSVRYQDVTGVVGGVYFPEAMFDGNAPETCFLEIEFPDCK